ncbi:MAG: DUF6612 family protein, partial [Candidatus Altarchaeaceae archaeon]
MKKLYAAIGILGIVLMLLLSGCIEEKKEISKEKIESAMKNVESYTVDINTSMSVAGMQMSFPMTIKVDVKNKKMQMSTEIMNQKMDMYLIGNVYYMKSFGVWTKQEINETPSYQLNEVKCWKNIKIVGEEKVDGIDCYKISVDADEDCLKKITQQKLSTSSADEITKNIEIKEVYYWIDKNTNLIKKEKLTAEMTQEGIGTKITLNMEMIFKDYGKTSVELPEEAKSAK